MNIIKLLCLVVFGFSWSSFSYAFVPKQGSPPSWVATDTFGNSAIMNADYTNNLYFLNGTSYSDEATFNTALGATKSGITRTIGAYIFGPNLVANGTFTHDIGGWSTDFAAISWSSGTLQLNGNSVSGPRAFQLIPTEVNKAYSIQGQAWDVSGNGQPALRVSVNNNLGQFAGTSPFGLAVAPGPSANLTGYFSAEGTAIYAGLYASGNNAGNYFFDNITVEECVPFQGMLSGQVGVKINATAPSSISATIVLWQAGGNERGRLRLEARTDFHLHYIVTWKNGGDALNPATDLDLGLLTASTPFIVEAQAGVDTFAATLNNSTRIYAPVGQMPGLAQMWIGTSFTGGTEIWTGTIEKVAVFKQAYPAASYLVLYGDSLTANSRGGYLGANTVAPPQGYWNFALGAAFIPPRRVIAKGYPGFGMAAVATKFLTTDPFTAAGGYGDINTVYGIEGGYNDMNNAQTAVPPAIASMVAAFLPNTKYFIFNIPNGEAVNQYSGGSVYNAFVATNSATLSTYGNGLVLGGHVVQLRELWVAAYNPAIPQDVIDHGHDISPSSQREDAIHFNALGGPTWFNAALAVVRAQGWSQ